MDNIIFIPKYKFSILLFYFGVFIASAFYTYFGYYIVGIMCIMVSIFLWGISLKNIFFRKIIFENEKVIIEKFFFPTNQYNFTEIDYLTKQRLVINAETPMPATIPFYALKNASSLIDIIQKKSEEGIIELKTPSDKYLKQMNKLNLSGIILLILFYISYIISQNSPVHLFDPITDSFILLVPMYLIYLLVNRKALLHNKKKTKL